MKILHFSNLFRSRRVRTVDFASVDVEVRRRPSSTVNFKAIAVRVLVVERPTVAVRALLRDARMAAVAEYSSALGDIMFARDDLPSRALRRRARGAWRSSAASRRRSTRRGRRPIAINCATRSYSTARIEGSSLAAAASAAAAAAAFAFASSISCMRLSTT